MKRLLAALALAALASAAPAATPVDVAHFDSLALRGGGHVVVRHGTQQSVTLVSGDLATSRFTVDRDGSLRIDACVRSCSGYRLEVEIVTPELDAIGVESGGAVRAEGAFPDRHALNLAVDGGGEIDATAMRADTVSAGISGGGAILTHVRAQLNAGINGGGSVRYRGDPAVNTGINGGGSVDRLGG
jgi:hypothetical protein